MIIFFIPKIKLNGSKIIEINYGEMYQEKGCTATYLGKNITDKIWYEGVVDNSKVGRYVIRCKVRKNKNTKYATEANEKTSELGNTFFWKYSGAAYDGENKWKSLDSFFLRVLSP